MKRNYETVSIELVLLQREDVITTSLEGGDNSIGTGSWNW